MLPTAKDWLYSLSAQACTAQLEHLDVLINCTALASPLLTSLTELTPAPACAWLLEHTPEHELAAQGPLLVRIDLTCEAQRAWLQAFLYAVHGEFRVLVLLSRWPFDALAAHLRGATQATWCKGTRSGVLRYYDTRLFRHFCEWLDPHQLRLFHAPVIHWYWLDHDAREGSISGFDARHRDAGNALSGLSLSDDQVLYLRAVSSTIQCFKRYDKTPREHGLPSREALIFCLLRAHLDIHRQGLEKHQHDAFIATVMNEHAPLTLSGNKASL